VLSFQFPEIQNSDIYTLNFGSGAVAWGTRLQFGRSLVRFMTVSNSGSLNFLENSKLVQPCTGIASPLHQTSLEQAWFPWRLPCFILAALHKILTCNASTLNVLFNCNTKRQSVPRPHSRAAVVVTLFLLCGSVIAMPGSCRCVASVFVPCVSAEEAALQNCISLFVYCRPPHSLTRSFFKDSKLL
jgi:hypothetical protein